MPEKERELMELEKRPRMRGVFTLNPERRGAMIEEAKVSPDLAALAAVRENLAQMVDQAAPDIVVAFGGEQLVGKPFELVLAVQIQPAGTYAKEREAEKEALAKAEAEAAKPPEEKRGPLGLVPPAEGA